MQVVHVEFEYRSSSFWSHRSEWRQLALAGGSAGWWVVCWHDDLDNRRRQDLPGLEVISLRELLVKKGRPYAEAIVLNWYDGDPSDPIRPKDVESKFDWRSQGLSRAQQRIIDRLSSQTLLPRHPLLAKMSAMTSASEGTVPDSLAENSLPPEARPPRLKESRRNRAWSFNSGTALKKRSTNRRN